MTRAATNDTLPANSYVALSLYWPRDLRCRRDDPKLHPLRVNRETSCMLDGVEFSDIPRKDRQRTSRQVHQVDAV